jgi:hypothetical protein
LGIPAALWLALRGRGVKAKLHILVICAVILAVLIPGKNFAHYFILVIPFLSVAAGIGLAHVLQWRQPLASVALVAVCVLIGFSGWKNLKYFTKYSPKAVSAAKHGEIFLIADHVARYLRDHTRPDDYIFQWGFEPELYFLADRCCPVGLRTPNRQLMQCSRA